MGKKAIFIFIGIAVILLNHCAKIGAPSGGKLDESPPEIKKSVPENFSTNTQLTEFEITFDEFIQLREINQKLLISPPLQERPEIRLKGKSLIVELQEELKPNTTYTFNFFDAIVDNNEGNPIENFEYVISTGDQLDSLSLSGKVIRAFDLKADENIYVLLHKNQADSFFVKSVPNYVTKADEEGNFRINNLKADTFRIYALKDANMNYMFDQIGEAIAFLDTAIFMKPDNRTELDSTLLDSIATILRPPDIRNIELFLFKEEKKEQYLKSQERNSPHHLLFIFNEPLIESPGINLIERDTGNDWFLREDYVLKDSVSFWIKDTSISNTEFLNLELVYLKEDTANNIVEFRDTLNLRYTKPAKIKSSRRGTEPEEVLTPTIHISSNISRGKSFDLNKKIKLETPTPISQTDTSKILLIEAGDTLKRPIEFTFKKDTLGQRIFYLSVAWTENKLYDLTFFPGAFVDMHDAINDTTILHFKTQSQEYYGAIILSLSNLRENLVVQLMDGKNEVMKERVVKNDSIIKFRYLTPGQYKLKAIVDWNSNGIWDTGNFKRKKQPEEVLFYKEEIQVRSNWDYEIEWIIDTRRKKQ